jgi:hypothetical protein
LFPERQKTSSQYPVRERKSRRTTPGNPEHDPANVLLRKLSRCELFSTDANLQTVLKKETSSSEEKGSTFAEGASDQTFSEVDSEASIDRGVKQLKLDVLESALQINCNIVSVINSLRFGELSIVQT